MIFLDSASGTKPYKEVIDVIADVLTNHWGNASADYSFGQEAQMIIDNVTKQVAKDINCNTENIIWTSGACEANNLAIKGTQNASPYLNFYTTKLEHASINKMQYNPVPPKINNDKDGFIDCNHLDSLISSCYDSFSAPLVSVCYANSEIGTIQDIKSISNIVHRHNGLLHVDATQIYPWESIDVQELGIDLMSVSGQKLHSVKGIGFLYVKDDIKLRPLISGSQQNGRRAGTLPTHLIAAFGKALEITRNSNEYNKMYVKALRNKLLNYMLTIPGVHLNGPNVENNRLPNNISLTIDGIKAEQLVVMCNEYDIMIAKGSACQSYNLSPSETLLAIGLSEEQALSTIRITLDEFNTVDEIEYVCDILPKIINRLREV